jgi:hypothetical protein
MQRNPDKQRTEPHEAERSQGLEAARLIPHQAFVSGKLEKRVVS